MTNRMQIALALAALALTAVATADTASAFPRFWGAVTLYYIPL
jgi:hypothetical protein